MRLLAAVFVTLVVVWQSTVVFASTSVLTVISENSRGLFGRSSGSSDVDGTFSKVKTIRGISTSLTIIPGDVSDVIVTLDDQGRLTALNSGDTSKVLWYVAIAGGRRSVYSSSLIHSRGVILCAIDNVLYGLDPSTGQVKWSSTLRNFISGNLVLLNEGQSVAFMTIDGYLCVFDVETGGLLWHREESSVQVRVKSDLSVAYSSGKHYVIVVLPDGRVLCLDSYSGDKMWESELRRRSMGSIGSIEITPVVAGSEVFVVDDSGALSSIDLETGKITWSEDLGVLSLSKEDEETLFVVTDTGELLAYDVDSKVRLWKLSLGKFGKKKCLRWRAPVMVSGKLWLLSMEGYLVGVNAFSGVIEESYMISGAQSLRYPIKADASIYVAAGKMGFVIVS
ncbi:PQQ-binding-like beta-propeller repeat protein [Anaplasma phagocytophilum]|uniref:PQQ-binding-like beta-propeller repeat protein n=1 Tax=Anaplasma phagocytophilum TaxID=948 RepID=UPI0005F90634|nr:PQQ-binding-like beta-propeller repeat protein [Anaplasma phagocytophilum]KJV99310.1 PQQ enzyme repeat family protein [Anaplasma phagocytophilum str. Annie]